MSDRNGCTCATRDPFATEHRELCPLRTRAIAKATDGRTKPTKSQAKRLAVTMAPEAYRDGWRAGAEAMRKAIRDECDEAREVIDALPIPDPPEGP